MRQGSLDDIRRCMDDDRDSSGTGGTEEEEGNVS